MSDCFSISRCRSPPGSVLPLVLVDDSLVVASAFVDADLSYLRERFPNLAVALVVSPRREILEALRRVAA